jgi:hypothetical protein
MARHNRQAKVDDPPGMMCPTTGTVAHLERPAPYHSAALLVTGDGLGAISARFNAAIKTRPPYGRNMNGAYGTGHRGGQKWAGWE